MMKSKLASKMPTGLLANSCENIMKHRCPRALLLFGLNVLVLGACATGRARVNQFERFAQAGIQFTDALPQVLEESLQATTTTSSLVLIESREPLSRDERLDEIEQSNEDLEDRVTILNDLRQHARLLRSYFLALQNLAEIEAESSGLTDVATGVVDAMGKVSPRIADATFGGTPVRSLVAPAASFVLTTYQSSVLNDELERHAETIESELNLQQAALKALAEAMRSDLETQFAAQDRDDIVLPYARDGDLPRDWNERRLDALKRKLQLTSVDAASRAAQNLRSSFVALVENRFDDAVLMALLKDINDVVTLVEDRGE